MSNANTTSFNSRVAEASKDFEELAWLPAALASESIGFTRASIIQRDGVTRRLHIPEALVRALEDEHAEPAVCIVENIGPRWIEELGKAWDLSPRFFVNHGRSAWIPNLNHSLWDEVFNVQRPSCNKYESSMHARGVFEHTDWHDAEAFSQRHHNFFRRKVWLSPYADSESTVSSHSVISWTRPRSSLYLFLVDRSLDHGPDISYRTGSILRTPLSTSRGGLVLPPLYGRAKQSMVDSLESIFEHDWHFNLLFLSNVPPDKVLPIPPMLYLFSASLWQTNLRTLDQQIKRISFRDLRKPTVKINDRLHDLRQDLYTLKESIQYARRWMPSEYLDWFKKIQKAEAYVANPAYEYDRLSEEASKLSEFLMDTFQLLMSTISTLDAQTSLDQAVRGTRLTWLAFIYAPLSFVTGIYGMNIKQINDSPLNAWVTIITLVVVMAGTGIAFVVFDSFPRWKQEIKRRRQKRAMSKMQKSSIKAMRNVEDLLGVGRVMEDPNEKLV